MADLPQQDNIVSAANVGFTPFGGTKGEISPKDLIRYGFEMIARSILISEEATYLAIQFTEQMLVDVIKKDEFYAAEIAEIEAKVRADNSGRGANSTWEWERFIQTQIAWKKLGALASLNRRNYGEDIVYRLTADKTVYGKKKAFDMYIQLMRERKAERLKKVRMDAEARRNELRVQVRGEESGASADITGNKGGDSAGIRPSEQESGGKPEAESVEVGPQEAGTSARNG